MRAFCLLFLCCQLLLGDPLNLVAQRIQKSYEHFYHAYHFHVSRVQVQIASGDMARLSAFLAPYANQQGAPFHLRPQQFLRKEGLVRVGDSLLKYQVIADMQVYKTKGVLKKDVNLDSQNTYAQNVPFEQFNTMPLDDSYINNSSTKSFLGANTLLSVDKVAPKILVYKNEIFSATLISGSISLETSLQALQNGSLNQVIEALNMESKKRVQVRITGLLKGEVL
ncbi:flagellar basal body P-ring formation chaperone FlgA [Helicobacter baculiformis]|uniref:Flagella basal body P-ring formation protein FlgA n=1 Tax=Helicobacter baculiformis TaxID=427351 RepID=A0ABV7ZHT0_9HELI|nr:flagellar basal body P-ring formation chaperone FlgA [Helicobacter baculiformis]